MITKNGNVMQNTVGSLKKWYILEGKSIQVDSLA